MAFLSGPTAPAAPPPPPAPPTYGANTVRAAGSQARAAAAAAGGFGFGGTEKTSGQGAAKPATAMKELLGA